MGTFRPWFLSRSSDRLRLLSSWLRDLCLDLSSWPCYHPHSYPCHQVHCHFFSCLLGFQICYFLISLDSFCLYSYFCSFCSCFFCFLSCCSCSPHSYPCH